MWRNLRRKTFLFIFGQFYCFEQKGLFTTNPNFLLDLLLFKLVEKNELSDYFRASFWDIFLGTKKSSFQLNSPKLLQNNRKALFSCMRLILRRKTVFVNICPVLVLCTKRVVYNKSKFSFEFVPFRTCWEKKTFLVLLSYFWESQFLD